MSLTKHDRKDRLRELYGYGSSKLIAEATERSEGHVSQVLNGKRRDKKVELAVARRLQLPVAEVFPEYYAEKVA